MGQREDNQYLMLTSLYGKSLTETMMGLNKKAMNTATQCDGILKGKRSIYLESLNIYLAVAEGCFEDALRKAAYLVVKLRKTKQMWFSLGFYLHLVSDALSTALEYNLIKGRSQQHSALKAYKSILRSMTTMSQSFDMMTPLCHLANARWYMLHGKEVRRRIIYKSIHFPVWEVVFKMQCCVLLRPIPGHHTIALTVMMCALTIKRLPNKLSNPTFSVDKDLLF